MKDIYEDESKRRDEEMIGIGKYHGLVYEGEKKNPKPQEFQEKEMWIQYGKVGICEGCGENKELHLFDGMWLCGTCIKTTIDEVYEEDDIDEFE